MMHSTYFGVDIYRNTEPGYRLRYRARTRIGGIAADTLDGIRALIRAAR